MQGSIYKANPIKKSRTFQLTKSPSMDDNIQYNLPARTATSNIAAAPKKSPVVEFPTTSPQLTFGEEMLHFGHPRHPLSLVKLPNLFTCAGCKEYGSGKRFVCQQCDFQLHDFCAAAPPTLKAHPLHYQHHLILFSKPGCLSSFTFFFFFVKFIFFLFIFIVVSAFLAVVFYKEFSCAALVSNKYNYN